jgi:hypothetical protein
MTAALLQVMLKHLPPSGSQLRLLDVDGRVGAAWSQQRRDLEIRTTRGVTADAQLAPSSLDAIAVFDVLPEPAVLVTWLDALRPGGRLIMGLTSGTASADQVTRLEQAGYTRILVEPALPGGSGVLLRGEKPHTAARTVDRIQQVADTDTLARGRYVHLLVQQTPNKPVWALPPDEGVQWQAVTVRCPDDEQRLLAFSSLPQAVAFMQPAVMQGHIRDVNKVARFSRETAQTWPLTVWLNPAVEDITDCAIILWSVDPQTAEAPDE